jgi:hypothetical protein
VIYARITFILYNLKALENLDGAASTVECRLGIYVYTTTEVIIASNIGHLPIRKVGQSIGKFRRSVIRAALILDFVGSKAQAACITYSVNR